MTIRSGVSLSLGRARDLPHTVSPAMLSRANGEDRPITFHRRHALGTPSGTTIVNMNNDTILKVNLEDLLDDQRALIDKVAEEFREKCLLSYSRMHDLVI